MTAPSLLRASGAVDLPVSRFLKRAARTRTAQAAAALAGRAASLDIQRV